MLSKQRIDQLCAESYEIYWAWFQGLTWCISTPYSKPNNTASSRASNRFRRKFGTPTAFMSYGPDHPFRVQFSIFLCLKLNSTFKGVFLAIVVQKWKQKKTNKWCNKGLRPRWQLHRDSIRNEHLLICYQAELACVNGHSYANAAAWGRRSKAEIIFFFLIHRERFLVFLRQKYE